MLWRSCALIFMTLWWRVTGNLELVQYIITCHTSDFVCFKRQYEGLRDHVLTGNSYLGIDQYVPYVVEYGTSGTCVMVSGLEESELVGISMNSESKEYSLTLEMPFRMHQLKNDSIICRKPSQDFGDIEKHVGPLMNFTGNATVVVTYTYRLIRKLNGDIHLRLHPEEIDITLDIPDLRDYDKNSESQTDEYKWSEWAFSVSRHIDAAEHFIGPYTNRLIDVHRKLPFYRFIILYPEELYTTINFNFSNGSLANEFN